MPIKTENFEAAILRLATKANLSPEEAMDMVSDLLPANLRAKYSDEEKPAPKKKREGPTSDPFSSAPKLLESPDSPP